MADAATRSAPAAQAPGIRRLDLAWLALVAVVVRVPAFVATRHVSFDDGVYGATVAAMRDGARPYQDIFSSQGPLQLPLLFLADLAGFRTLNAPRLLSLASGVAITLCVAALAGRLAGRRAALITAVLVTTSGSLLLVTTGISGDAPAIAFAVAALTAAFAYRDAPSPAKAVAIGGLVGAALAIKLLVAPILVPVTLVLLAGRRPRDVALAVATAVATVLVLAAPWGLDRVWEQSVAYHREPRRFTVLEAARRMVRTLVERDSLVVVTAAIAAVCAARRRRASTRGLRRWPPGPAVILGAWLGAQVLMLLAESAMWRPHVSQLIVPLGLLTAFGLPSVPSWRVLAVGWLVAFGVFAVNVSGIFWPGGYEGADAALARRLRRLPPGAWVVSDDPGFAWRTGHRVPDDFVDTSVKQLDQGNITRADLVAAARRPEVCAVVVWSPERFGRFPDLAEHLADAGYEVGARFGDGRVLLVRPCRR